MKGYKNVSNNFKKSSKTQINHKGTRTPSSYHRSDQSRREQKSELIKKHYNSHPTHS
jgi:hypothetical protein